MYLGKQMILDVWLKTAVNVSRKIDFLKLCTKSHINLNYKHDKKVNKLEFQPKLWTKQLF